MPENFLDDMLCGQCRGTNRTLKSSCKMSKPPFVLTPKNYPRSLKVLCEHAAVLPTYVGIVEL